MSQNIEDSNDTLFDSQVIQSNIPVIVDFWAPWCGPCRTLAPLLEKLAKKYDGKIKFVKLDVDQNETVSTKYSVKSIPTLILFKNGKEERRIVGLADEKKIAEWIDK